MIHDLKITSDNFEQVLSRMKKAEFRKNDRDFKNGDYMHLQEWDGKDYTGRDLVARITCMTKLDEYIKDPYVMLSIQVMV